MLGLVTFAQHGNGACERTENEELCSWFAVDNTREAIDEVSA